MYRLQYRSLPKYQASSYLLNNITISKNIKMFYTKAIILKADKKSIDRSKYFVGPWVSLLNYKCIKMHFHGVSYGSSSVWLVIKRLIKSRHDKMPHISF